MPPTHPGVYVHEVPQGPPPITAAPTSVTAFVGRSQRGPVDQPVHVRSTGEVERLFGPPTADTGLAHALRSFFANGGREAVVVRVDEGSATAQVALPGGLLLEALGPGAWGTGITVGVSHPTADEATAVARTQGIDDPEALFTLWISLDDQTEVFQHVTLTPGPRQLTTVLQASSLLRVTGPLPSSRPPAGTYPTTSPGSDGPLPSPDAYGAPGRGLDALEQVDLVNLIVLPPPARDTPVPDEVWRTALAVAARRRALLLVDTPPALTAGPVTDWLGRVGLTGANARDAVLYHPHIRQHDPVDGLVRSFAPSPAVAGVYARSDQSRGVWKSPAGSEAQLLDVVSPEVQLTDDQGGQLTVAGVNPIRTMPGRGTLLWGARTLAGAGSSTEEYRYVAVRRLALHVSESLDRGLGWVVFEPNAAQLWAAIRHSVAGFLEGLFRQGAFAGASAREAYLVRCDSSTTTPADVAAGLVHVVVGFAPLKPAEFVVLKLTLRTQSA